MMCYGARSWSLVLELGYTAIENETDSSKQLSFGFVRATRPAILTGSNASAHGVIFLNALIGKPPCSRAYLRQSSQTHHIL